MADSEMTSAIRIRRLLAEERPQLAGYEVTDWLRIYAAHCHDHADQVRRARRA